VNYPGSALCLAFLLTMGCRDVQDLASLGAALNEQYPNSPVSVSLTDGLILTVTVADSALAVASCESQAAVAMRIAESVRDNYGGFRSIDIISIAFAPRVGVRATVTATALPTRFARTLVSGGLTGADSVKAVESCKAWRELQ